MLFTRVRLQSPYPQNCLDHPLRIVCLRYLAAGLVIQRATSFARPFSHISNNS